MRKYALIAAAYLLPVVVFAQGAGVEGLLNKLARWINIATPIVFALALLAFFWGLAVYIFNAGDEEKRKQGKDIMIWGVIALFVMVSVFGIVRILRETFGINANETAHIPTVQGNNVQ